MKDLLASNARSFRKVITCAVFAGLLVGFAQSSEAAVPYQFIAKMYSEALGRIPDQAGWRRYVSYFEANGCAQWSLKAAGQDFYFSGDFAGLGYDNPARLLTLYRGALNREPDGPGFDHWLDQLNSGASWGSVVNTFFDSREFAGLVRTVCSKHYYFGTQPAITIPTSGGGFQGGTGEQLQALLDRTPPGGTVWLAQKAVVRLRSPLRIRDGRTLATTGGPGPRQYALMGRLVRASAFAQTLVEIESGAKLLNVWVDGQRGDPNNYDSSATNVQLLGGSGATVADSRLSNSYGWTNLHALGSAEGRPCAGNTITGNLVTAYSSEHWPSLTGGTGKLTDGLSIACENALVENNEIIDATDVAIVLFTAAGPGGSAVQRSQVRNNRILSAGNSAYGGIVADTLDRLGFHNDFTGASVSNNLMWSGVTHFDIGLSVGTRAWFGIQNPIGLGVSFDSNTTGSESIVADLGIGVSGMGEVWVMNNTVSTRLQDVSRCPTASVGASVSWSYAWETIQPYRNVLIEKCIGH